MATGYTTDLGRTQRGEIWREIQEADNVDSLELAIENAETADGIPAKPDLDKEEAIEDRFLWLKYIGCFILVAGALAAIIAVVAIVGPSYGKNTGENDELGGVEEEVVIAEECPEVVVLLGLPIRVTCYFSASVSYKIQDTEVTYEPMAEIIKPIFNCTEDSNFTVTCEGPAARCSNNGVVTLRFANDYEMSTKIRVTGGVVRRTEIQENMDDDTFSMMCQADRVCEQYNMVFKGNNSVKISQFDTCETTFSDVTGYDIRCAETDVDPSFVQDYGTSSITCELQDNFRNRVTSKEFELPICADLYDQSCFNKTEYCEGRDMTDCDNNCQLLEDCLSVPTRNHTTTAPVCPTRCYPKWCKSDTGSNKLVYDMQTLYEELCQ